MIGKNSIKFVTTFIPAMSIICFRCIGIFSKLTNNERFAINDLVSLAGFAVAKALAKCIDDIFQLWRSESAAHRGLARQKCGAKTGFPVRRFGCPRGWPIVKDGPQINADDGKMLVGETSASVVFFAARKVVEDRIEQRIKFVFHACALREVFAVDCKQV